jgi:hypothetical protein
MIKDLCTLIAVSILRLSEAINKLSFNFDIGVLALCATYFAWDHVRLSTRSFERTSYFLSFMISLVACASVMLWSSVSLSVILLMFAGMVLIQPWVPLDTSGIMNFIQLVNRPKPYEYWQDPYSWGRS